MSLLGTKDTAMELTTGEAFVIWKNLVMRYDIYEMTDIFQNFANDPDFNLLLTVGKNILNKIIEQLENLMSEYKIPLPPRPPKSINTPANTEVLRDELMFRLVYSGVQNFLTHHINALLNSQNSKLVKMYRDFEIKEMDYYIKLGKYGRLKGWLSLPPEYKNSSE